MTKLHYMDMTYYILRKDGAYASVCLWEGYSPGNPHKFVVHDGTLRSEIATPLLKGYSQDWPPMPVVPEDLKKDSEYLK
jgi:N4-(beta-N-acetylglucosaminyl)-L-asparaginase